MEGTKPIKNGKTFSSASFNKKRSPFQNWSHTPVAPIFHFMHSPPDVLSQIHCVDHLFWLGPKMLNCVGFQNRASLSHENLIFQCFSKFLQCDQNRSGHSVCLAIRGGELFDGDSISKFSFNSSRGDDISSRGSAL